MCHGYWNATAPAIKFTLVTAEASCPNVFECDIFIYFKANYKWLQIKWYYFFFVLYSRMFSQYHIIYIQICEIIVQADKITFQNGERRRLSQR